MIYSSKYFYYVFICYEVIIIACSCRECGIHLTPTSICNLCLEHVSWICRKCLKIDDVTHKHNNYEISNIIPITLVTSYIEVKIKYNYILSFKVTEMIDAVTKTINSYFLLVSLGVVPARVNYVMLLK